MLIPILIAVMTFFFSTQSLFARKYTENYCGPNPGDASQVYNILYGTLVSLFTLCIGGFSFAPSKATLLFGLANALVLFAYNSSLVSASVKGPYSFLMICLLSGGILVPLLCNMVLGERLTAMQITGIVVLIASIVSMNLQGLSFKEGKPSKLYFLLCAALFLTNGTYSQIMSEQQRILGGLERTEMIIITYTVTAIFAAITLLCKSPKHFTSGFRAGKKAYFFGVCACLCSTAATNIVVFLLSRVPSPTVLYAIDNCGVLLLSCLYSICLFHEKPTISQLAGMALSTAGIILLSI